MEPMTLIVPRCTCCEQPSELLPREDLGTGLAVCAITGNLYQPNGNRYEPATLPTFPPAMPNSIQIDLSRTGYA